MRHTTLPKTLYLALTALLVSNVAFAHTGIKSQVLEGNTIDNALTIGHGCEASGKGIIAQSVVFPTVAPTFTASDGSTITDIGQVIQQPSLAGLADVIQSKDIFTIQKEKYDALGNVTGFYGRTGLLDPTLQGRVPFAFTAPNFLPTSCAKSLNIQLAVADICVAGIGTAKIPSIQPTKVNLWIPDNGSQYAIKGAAAGVDGVGEPTTLQIIRDLAVNPLDPACGAGIDVTVTPSAAEVDANLGIPAYWSK